MPTPTEAAAGRVRRDHDRVLDAVDRCADAVADSWDGDAATDRGVVAPRMEAALRRDGVFAAFPTVLADAVDAAGFELTATAVPAPPYVAVASTGPVLRATVGDGRLVVSLRSFAVERDDVVRYVRRSTPPTTAVDVSLR